MRHTAASIRLGQGDHPKVVQEMLGHGSIAITLDLYSHLTPSLQVESAERTNATFQNIRGEKRKDKVRMSAMVVARTPVNKGIKNRKSQMKELRIRDLRGQATAVK